MNLQELKLPAALIADLYANVLIDPGTIDTKPKDNKKENEKSLSILGGNARRITIVVADSSHAFMADEELSWLQKMLQACKLTLGDVAIVNILAQKTTITLIKKELSPLKMLLLGVNPGDLELAFNFPPFKLQEHDKCTYLFAPSPKDLNQETKEAKLLKSKLWVSLQQLFEV